MTTTLLKTAQKFSEKYARAIQEVEPPCIDRPDDLPPLPCKTGNPCPMKSEAADCRYRKAIAKEVRSQK